MTPLPNCLARANVSRLTVLSLVLGASLVGSFRARGDFEPGTALSFDGAARSVQVAHNLAFNSYPLTASAWIKTSSATAAVAGVVSKYAPGSGNGWAVIASSGHVFAWYYSGTAGNFVGSGGLGMDGGVVADGQWHHIVFVVDPTGGTLYVDSEARVHQAWNGIAAATTTAQPLQIGRYPSQATNFIGDIDEVSVWSRALSGPEVNDLKRRGPTGGEGSISALWKTDDGAGTQLTDSSPNLRHGTLTGSPTWVTSTAPITRGQDGDVLGYENETAIERRIIITSVPGQESFRVNVTSDLRRYDNTVTAAGPTDVPVTFTSQLLDVTAGGASIALQQSTTPQTVTVPAHAAGTPSPTIKNFDVSLPIAPVQWSDLLPRHTYQVAVTLSHTDPVAGEVVDFARSTTTTTLLPLSGKLFAGALETRFTSVSNDPVAVATSGVDVPTLNTKLLVTAGAGYLPQRADFGFGGGAGFGVQISNTNGDAVIVDGSSPVLEENPAGPLAAGTALSFDGAARSVNVPHAAAFNNNPLTVSAWIKTTEAGAVVGGIVSKYLDGSFNGWALFTYAGHVRGFYIANGASTILGTGLGLDGGFVADGQWHHVAMVVETSGATMYVDATARHHLNWVGTPAAATTTQPLQIGRYSAYPNGFSGQIDEVSVWSSPLSDYQILDLQRRSPRGTEPSLQASWRLDNGAGTQATDSTAFGRHGVLANSPAWIASTAPIHRVTPYPLGAGTALAWTGGYATIPHSPALNSYPLTVSAWIKTSTNDASVRGIVSKYADGSSNGWAMFLSGGRVYGWYTLNNSRQVFTAPWGLQSGFVADSQWHHLAMAIDASGGTLYVDAVAHSHLNWTGAPAATTTTEPLQIGRYYNYATGFLGQIDEVSVWSAGFSNYQVYDLMRRAPFGNEDCLEALWTVDPDTTFVLTDRTDHDHDGEINGAWTFVPSAAPVRRGPGALETVAGMRTRAEKITLSATGLAASVKVFFPTGFGYTLDDKVRLLEPSHTFQAQALTEALVPVNPVLAYTPGTLFVCEESKPLLIKAGGLECNLATGRVRATALISAQSVRRKEVLDLAAATGLPAGANAKRSNDAWTNAIASVAGPVEVRSGARGDARLYATGLGSAASIFELHHPLGTRLDTSSAQVDIADDQFLSTSRLQLNGVAQVPQGRDCYECLVPGVSPVTQTLSFTASLNWLGMTPDGGLVKGGSLAAPMDVAWGIRSAGVFAQTVHGVSAGSFMAPGFSLRGDQTTRGAADRPGVLLNSGSSVVPDGAAGLYLPERPDSAAYGLGTGSYAGFNFSVPTDGALLASCRLGDQFFPNRPLRGCCKYYARTGGVSGLHQVLRGSIAGSFVIDGFRMQIDRYRLSYLSNENADTGINGVLTVGGYCRFQQEFEKLYLDCFARMTKLELPSVTVKKRLYYWDAEVRPQTMEFASGFRCFPPPPVPPPTVLVMGCEAWVSHVEPTLPARLAIAANGRLLPRKDLSADQKTAYPDLDSVLHLPGTIPLRGPQGNNYSLVPNTPAFFSLPTEPPPPDNPDPPAAAPNGFLHFAAKTDVSFFEDLRIHVHTSGLQANTTSPLHIMGGWTEGANTYWTSQTFDPDRRGVPVGVSKAAYRANNNPAYLTKATRNWKGIVKINDCPLKWNRDARLFTTLEGCTTDLPIFSVDTRINALGPQKADLRFAKDFLPNFSLSNLAINELTESTGVMTAFENAGQGLVREAMQRGLSGMESMLQNQINTLIEQPLNRGLDPFANEIGVFLTARLNTTPPVDGTALAAAFTASFNDAGAAQALRDKLQVALTTAGDATSLIGEIRRRLVDGRAAAQSIRDILAKDGSGKRHLLPSLAEKLLEQFDAPVLAQLGGSVVREFLDVQVGELEEAFSALDDTLAEIDGVFARSLQSLDAAGNFATEIKTRLTGLQVDIDTTINQGRDEIANQFRGINVAAMNLSAPSSVERLKEDVRRILRQRLVTSRITSEMQRILRERLADLNDSMSSAMDSVFQQVNDTLRSALVKAAAGLDGTFKQFGGAGDIASTGAVAKINGHAIILGDKLNELRVDGEFSLSFAGDNGAKFDLHAFLEVKDVSSRGGPGCGAPPGKELTEITIGAERVHIGWKAGPSLTADLGVKFALEGDQDSAVPVNFGGYVKVVGGLKFAVLEINELALAVAVGKIETYVSAGARVKINGWEFAGGFFAGKSCTLDPIVLWAPDARQVIGREKPDPVPANFDDSFAGVYFYAEGWIPINELFGIPSSCVLTIKVGAGMGFFVNLAGAEPEIGAKFLLGLDGEVICLLGIHAEFILRGRKRGLDFSTDGLRLVGEGSLCLEIGPCPFCVDICASLTIIYEDGGWDYDI